MTDDAAKAANGAPKKPPAQVTPATTPAAAERAASTPAAARGSVPPSASGGGSPRRPPAQVPPPSAPAPTESLDNQAAANLPSGTPAPSQVPPPAAAASPPPVQPPPRQDPPFQEPMTRVAAAPVATQSTSHGLSILLALVCVVTLLGAAYLYWLSRATDADVLARLNALDQTVAAMDQRVAAVEHRPVPAPVDLGPLDQRLTALEQKPPPQAQLTAAGQAEIAGLAGRVDQLLARADQLGTRQQADIARLNDQIAGQDARITEQDAKIASASQAGSNAGGQVDALVTRERRLASLQAASGALAAGRPLGVIPGAPPALAQFADKAPPTEAALRLSFGDAARAAHEAGMPSKADAPFLDRVWARMQSSLTVRQGDRIVVGDAVSGVLAHAESQLDAGDLAGAVTTLGELSGPAASAMAPWRQRAQSLLDARAALLALARG